MGKKEYADFIQWVVIPGQEIVLEDIGHVAEIIQEDIVQETGRIQICRVWTGLHCFLLIGVLTTW